MSVFKDKQGWYFKVCINYNQYKSKRYKTQKEAKEAEAKYLFDNKDVVNKNFNLIADEYFKYALTINKESSVASSLYNYNKHIKDFFNCPISKIDIDMIKKWHDYMDKKNLSVAFKNKVLSTLKNILNYAMKNYGLEKNVASIYGTFRIKQDQEQVKKLNCMSFDDYKKFMSVIDEYDWYAFFTTLFYTGCRKSELFSLKWEDIDFGDNTISITKTISRGLNGEYVTSTKNNKNRKIKMNKTLADVLLQHKNNEMSYSNFNEKWYVFGGYEPFKRSTVDRYKSKYFKFAHLPEYTLHSFRHTCVSILASEFIKSSKGKIDTTKFFIMLSNRMGHSVEVMQRTYMHLFEDTQDEIVDIFDNL